MEELIKRTIQKNQHILESLYKYDMGEKEIDTSTLEALIAKYTT